jgi:hypothetical protein
MVVSGQCHAPAALYPRAKDPRYALYRRLGGPESCSEHKRLEEKSFASAREWTPVVQSVVRVYTDWATPAPRSDSTDFKPLTYYATLQFILMPSPLELFSLNLKLQNSEPWAACITVQYSVPAQRKRCGRHFLLSNWTIANGPNSFVSHKHVFNYSNSPASQRDNIVLIRTEKQWECHSERRETSYTHSVAKETNLRLNQMRMQITTQSSVSQPAVRGWL